MIDLAIHPAIAASIRSPARWVLVSPQRTDRPWQGQMETPASHLLPPYDAACYLCPGNPRAGGVSNPAYTSTFVFENDFPGLRPDTPAMHVATNPLMSAETEQGVCRVICFSPRHDLSIARMEIPAIETIVETWTGQYRELAAKPFINHVQIFEKIVVK